MISITKLFEFEAAHHLPNYEGECAKVHGHSYKLEVEVSGEINMNTGMIIDFTLLKYVVRDNVLVWCDHSDLNHTFELPTAESMVMAISYILADAFKNKGVSLVRVRLWATSTSYAEWRAE